MSANASWGLEEVIEHHYYLLHIQNVADWPCKTHPTAPPLLLFL